MQTTLIAFVITGSPRSGTAYVARLLSNLGLYCGHEECFNPWNIKYEAECLNDNVWGDCSWMAVPFVPDLPPATKVFHLVRDPVKTINSIIATGQLDWPSDYQRFIAEHMWGDASYWPSETMSEAQRFWVRWNQLMEESGRVTRRIRVEKVRDWLPEIFRELKPDCAMSRKQFDLAMNSVPSNYNKRPRYGRSQDAIAESDLTEMQSHGSQLRLQLLS